MDENVNVSSGASQPSFAPLNQELDAVRGWLKFIGVVTLIGGILQALTIVGIFVAWLPIWMGLLLMNASKNARQYTDFQEIPQLVEYLRNLRKYFIIQGVLLIVSFASAILIALIYGAIIIAAIGSQIGGGF